MLKNIYTVYLKDVSTETTSDLWLSEGSEGFDQGIVVLCVRWFYGHVNDVDGVLSCVLYRMKEELVTPDCLLYEEPIQCWTFPQQQPHLHVLLLIETRAGLQWSALQKWFSKTWQNLIKIPKKKWREVTF